MIEENNTLLGEWCRLGTEHTKYGSLKTISDLWLHSDTNGLKCPRCKGNLILIQAEETQDWENPYKSYDTIVECLSCPYKTQAISYTQMGSVKQYDVNQITICGWSPSGSRVETTYEHILDYQLLKELKKSEELVEFLIIDDHVIQVIG